MSGDGCGDCRGYRGEDCVLICYVAEECMEKGRIMAYIRVENLKYRYPNTTKLALDGLDFEIEKGSFVGIIGENGAGKVRSVRRSTVLFRDFSKGLMEEKF